MTSACNQNLAVEEECCRVSISGRRERPNCGPGVGSSHGFAYAEYRRKSEHDACRNNGSETQTQRTVYGVMRHGVLGVIQR